MGLRGWVKGLRLRVKGLRVGSLRCLGFFGVFHILWCFGVLGCLGVTVKLLRGLGEGVKGLGLRGWLRG